MRFARLVSMLAKPGPYRMFTPAFPRVPTAGTAKAAVLNWTGRPLTVGEGGAAAPLPTTWMRAPMLADPVISSVGDVVKLGVNGAPVWNCMTPESTHRLVKALRNLLPAPFAGSGML